VSNAISKLPDYAKTDMEVLNMSELLDWVEKAAQENLKFRLQNAETLAKEASSTLTVLLAGIGAAFAYAAKGLEQPSPTPLALGALVLATWLMITGVLLVWNCMLTTSLPAPTNEPKNLYQKGYEIDALREAELKNIQERIEELAKRNHRVAAWLDRCRLLAITSLFISAVVAAVWAAR
jgi:hypothetical protein